MSLPLKTRFLNLFRNVFRMPLLEKTLAKATHGKPMNHLFSKLIPNHYQYPLGSIRDVKENGILLQVDIGDFIGHCIYFGFDGTERRSYERLFSLVQPGFHVIDVGANVGYTSLVLAQRVGQGAVAGFEPDPINFEQALINMGKNKLSNIQLYYKGLGESSGTAYLEERLPTCRGANRVAVNGSTGIEFGMATLDGMFAEISFSKVDLIKVDVEGYELKVLRGAQSVLKQFKPILFIEVDEANLRDQGDSASSLITYLKELGYTSFLQADGMVSVSLKSEFSGCHFDLIVRH